MDLLFGALGGISVSTAGGAGHNMEMETKFLRLRTQVELGTRFGDWSVCWLGGWQKHGLSYLVILGKTRTDSRAGRVAASEG